MNKTVSRLLHCLLRATIFSSFVISYPAFENRQGAIPETHLLVRFAEGLIEPEMRQVMASIGAQEMRSIPHIGYWRVMVAPEEVDKALALLKNDRRIASAEVNGTVQASGITPNDGYYLSQQNNLRLIGLPEAWVFTRGGPVIIAVIDTGIDLNHPDLESKIWANIEEIPGNGLDEDLNGYIDDVNGWDFVFNDAVPQDDQSHGSHISGIAAAATNNHSGIAGISWFAQVMPIKVLNSRGTGYWADIAEAIVYAVDNGARILNLSFGNAESSETIEAAVTYANSQGALVVAAAGNSAVAIEYPAALSGVLAVAATDQNDAQASFNNYGPSMDIAAPGVAIFSANRSGSYYVASGTSMATAHVSGLVALVWSLRPDWTAAQVSQVITSTAAEVSIAGWDPYTGWGRIDAAEAIFQIAQPVIHLSASRQSLTVGDVGAVVTATITSNQGQPAPDGLAVSFLSTSGSAIPLSGVTIGGVVTTTFTSAQVGVADVTGQVGKKYRGSISLIVGPQPIYLPLIAIHDRFRRHSRAP